ncbi:MAG: potassium-transporting ATPase subunit KdpC [Rubrobacter sp.]|nr:potassium-transporting ATPase subunit KdpC [Rubrobacter sp.]
MEAREDIQTNSSISTLIRPAVVSAVLVLLVGGLAYPLVTTLVAQLVFPYQAQGSFVERNGEVVGSHLIGQQFTEPQYFHPRPSATLKSGSTDSNDAEPYNAAQSQGSNQGPTNQALIDAVNERAQAYREENNLPQDTEVPVDAVTSSASGLDPHITPANADLQVPRVARGRSISEDEVRRLVQENTEGRLLGIFGEPRVNVLELNLTLDKL